MHVVKERIKYCKQQKPQRVTYPEHATVEFTKIHNQLMQPFVLYTDFESVLTPPDNHNVSVAPPVDKKLQVEKGRETSEQRKIISDSYSSILLDKVCVD